MLSPALAAPPLPRPDRFQKQGTQCRKRGQRRNRMRRRRVPAAGRGVEHPDRDVLSRRRPCRQDCSAPPRRSSSRSPHEREQSAQPKDAKSRQRQSRRRLPYRGYCGEEFYKRQRLHWQSVMSPMAFETAKELITTEP